MTNRNEWTDEKLFSRLLNNTSDRTYWDNISALRKRPTKEVFNKAIELTTSKGPKARRIGIDVLAQLGPIPRPFYSESNKRFFELLKTEKATQITVCLLYAISHNNHQLSKTQIDILCKFANTKNSSIKEALVYSLLTIDNPRAIDTLIKLSTDQSGHIRDWATFGLGSQIERNNKKIRDALWNRVNDTYPYARSEAIIGLTVRKDVRVKEIIKRELLDGEFDTLLFAAIEQNGDPEFLLLLRLRLKKDRADKKVSSAWLSCLKDCIKELSKKAKTK